MRRPDAAVLPAARKRPGLDLEASMLDGVMRRMVDPPLAVLARPLAAAGIGADRITLAALACGLAAAGSVALALPAGASITLLLLGRLGDGLDGAVARQGAGPQGGATDFGGYIDIVFDFLFYGAVPLAFALRDPTANALAAAVVLLSFYVNGATFLAFAIFAAKRGLVTRLRGAKSLYFTAGLAEGTETIAVFIAMCLWPRLFPQLAYGFAGLCALTSASRIALARRTLQ